MPQVPSGLGPWCVGTRVVVRRRLSGRTGPSGGPALTDLLGILDHWGD
ncbi:MAG: N-acetylglutamate synthase, partial [Nocardioidaceae bacterium]|nr:N-acetylglutamate synthase [Nocardioidaceae bacterium]